MHESRPDQQTSPRESWALGAHLHAMSDRERADAVLEHVAVLAFLYYPGIEVDDPSYSLADDIEWCLARLGDVADVDRERIGELFARRGWPHNAEHGTTRTRRPMPIGSGIARTSGLPSTDPPDQGPGC